MKSINKLIYKHLNKVVLFAALLLTANGTGFAQDILSIKGTVTDTTGMAVIGATVQIQGTTKGTITDVNGNFSIECTKGATLKFSSVGYKSQEVSASSTTIKIVLQEDNVHLEEVVVVGIGYGTMRKTDLTGAIASVSSDKFNKGVISTSEQLIQGKIAGVTVIRGSGDPTKGASIRLRGGTSLTAGNGPLFVVDGVPGVDVNTISPNDIASMDVLKDASAAAIYGSRGANGVIIVTTKKSKEGRMSTEYNSYIAIGTAAKNLDLLSGDQFRKVMRDSSYYDKMFDYGANTDWQKEIERTAITHSHSLSVDAGNTKSSYRASLNYLSNQGIIINSDLERLGGSIDVNHKTLNDKLNIEVNLNSTFDNYQPTNYSAFSTAYLMNPTMPVKDEDGNYVEIPGIGYQNPVALLNQRTQDESRLRFLGYTKFDLDIIQGLKATLNLSYTLNSHQNRMYLDTEEKLYGYIAQGQAIRSLDDASAKQMETYLNFTKQISDLSVNAMAGYSYLYNMNEGFGASRERFATNSFLYNNLGAGTNPKAGDVYSYKNDAKLISFFGRLNLNFKSKYMFTGTLRRDGSSKFGANNKWGIFPSASLAWRLSDEDFMKWTAGWASNLKLRAGYGITGNQESFASYQSLQLYGQDANSPSQYYDAATETWKQAYGIIQNANKNLKWEQTAQLNFGLDFTVFNRVNGSIEYYDKRTTDLLYVYAVPQPPYPYPTMLANVGDLSNKGIEANANIQIVKGNNFTWSLDINCAKNTQKIDKLSNTTFSTKYASTSSLNGLRGLSNVFTQRIQEGYVVGTFYGPVLDKLDNGAYVFKDFDADGKGVTDGKDEDDYRVLGDAQPDFTTGFGMNFGLYDFDFSFFMNGVFGQNLVNASLIDKMDEKGLLNNPNYNIPDKALTDDLKAKSPIFSSYWVEDGSFLRMQNMTLGYTFPLKANNYVKKARIYTSAENLFVITKYSGVDPEINLDGLQFPGVERNDNYPKPRTFSFGLSVQF